jgi:hypothetical protein
VSEITHHERCIEMENTPADWTSWIITTVVGMLTASIGTIVALAKLIETQYTREIANLKLSIDANAKEITLLKNETKECQEDRLKLAVRVGQLEGERDHPK